MSERQQVRRSPWPHRLAVALALVTFPLIWVGGLVTTYDAGMAVPDWPGTYGYNLLLYPWQSWLAAPWDLFIEHGHRLLGATAGLVAIGLVTTSLVSDQRRWLRWAACGALALVIAQGVLGGARVLFDQRLVALIHGCVGPLFFAYLAALIVATSRWWQDGAAIDDLVGKRLAGLAWMTVSVAYLQLALGAIVRHVPLSASPEVFRAALVFHLAIAGVLAIQIGLTTLSVARWSARSASGVTMPAILLPLLFAAQVLLGLATYVAKYSWPDWLGAYHFAAAYVIQEKSLTQSLITTAHVANGSLILFLSVYLAMRSTRGFFQTANAGSNGRGFDTILRAFIREVRRMSTSALTAVAPRAALFGRIADFVELTKPRIAVLELVVVLAAGFVASRGQPHPQLLLQAMIGTLLVAASASAANQWIERRQDARMARTASRPLPAGRLSSREALAFSLVCLIAGGLQLATVVNLACAGWALLTWAIYVVAYTPLKTKSALNTAVGAVAGALPVFIGWSAVDEPINSRALALLLVLFLWQFPHFMAIAWLYRRDYAQAGYQMLTVVEPTGRRAGWQAVLAALALVPVSVVPVLGAPGLGSLLYVCWAALLGAAQLGLATFFWRQTNDFTARLLLRASLVYLPTMLLMLMLASWI